MLAKHKTKTTLTLFLFYWVRERLAGVLRLERRYLLLESKVLPLNDTPKEQNYFLLSLCSVCARHHLQNFFTVITRSTFFLFLEVK